MVSQHPSLFVPGGKVLRTRGYFDEDCTSNKCSFNIRLNTSGHGYA